MTLETVIFDYLSNDGAVAALVGTRIYPGRLPEKSILPAVSFHKVSANRIYTYDTFEDTDPFVTARVQFDCWFNTFDGAAELGDAVMAALSGYDGSVSGDLIQASFAVNEFDTYEGTTKLHRRILDFSLSYEDTVTANS